MEKYKGNYNYVENFLGNQRISKGATSLKAWTLIAEGKKKIHLFIYWYWFIWCFPETGLFMCKSREGAEEKLTLPHLNGSDRHVVIFESNATLPKKKPRRRDKRHLKVLQFSRRISADLFILTLSLFADIHPYISSVSYCC